MSHPIYRLASLSFKIDMDKYIIIAFVVAFVVVIIIRYVRRRKDGE